MVGRAEEERQDSGKVKGRRKRRQGAVGEFTDKFNMVA